MEYLERAAADLLLPALGEEADWLGRLDKVIRHLRGLRADVIAELAGPVAGTDYAVVEGRKANRSYNTAALVASFADQGWDLKDLLAADAARLTWRWTELRRAAQQANVTLVIAQHEVEDDGDVEAPAIGETWVSQYRVEGV